MTMCGACADSNRIGAPGLAVAVPAACERILVAVPAPAMNAGDDARVVLARTRGALSLANARIAKSRACFTDVRSRFATGK